MDKLISDCAKAEIVSRVKDILLAWHSESCHQNPNFAECSYQACPEVVWFSCKHMANYLNTCLSLVESSCTSCPGMDPTESEAYWSDVGYLHIQKNSFYEQVNDPSYSDIFLPHSMRNGVGGMVLQCMFVML
jgi:hypothetical protein